ncbi:MAG: extracellular solute-binding protein [Enhydrobacter sp.]|nr:MAG: extracellular solute-binding protein [Enhydrobacter sp.]
MRVWGRLALGAALALVPVGLQAEMGALERDARSEGHLTWYVAHYTSEAAADLANAFGDRYGVKVKVVHTTAQVSYQRLLQDLKNKQAICDVFSSTDVGHYVRLKDKGYLARYEPQNAAKIAEPFRSFDRDGFYHATSAGFVLLTYNTTELPVDRAPKKWTDLLELEWKHRIATGHPGFSGYVGTWAVAMRKLYGWSFFERLEKNKPQIGRSINDTLSMLSAGQRQLGVGAAGPTLARATRGSPLAITFPADGAVLVIAPSAVMKDSRNPNAARLFIEFLNSTEASRINAAHFAVPIRPEVTSPPGLRPLQSVKTIRPTVSEIAQGIPEVIDQWRETFGN